MAVSAPALHDALVHIVGREHVVGDPPALAAYAVDGVVPRWMARPGDAAAVSELLALARAEGLAVAPRGSGSSVTLGNPPRRLDLIVDLSRLSAVVEYVPEDLVVTVEAGVPLGVLNARLAQRGQMLPLDPIAGLSRTIGGVLACNAAGPSRFRYGTGRDMLLGVRFVQADGTVTWGGAKVVKSVTGYDVPKLFVGSLGTLGIVVEATLRLNPVPAARASWLFAFDSHETAGSFLAALVDSALEPDRITLLNSEATRASGYATRYVAVLVSIASVKEAVDSQSAAVGRLASGHGARWQTPADSIWSALGEALAGPVVLKLNGQPKRLVAGLAEVEQRSARLGLEASIVSQPASGTLHCALRGPLPDGAAFNANLLAPLRDAVSPEGGSVVVEQAPPQMKADLDVWGPVALEAFTLMSGLKREFDPTGVLNPGRFVGGL